MRLLEIGLQLHLLVKVGTISPGARIFTFYSIILEAKPAVPLASTQVVVVDSSGACARKTRFYGTLCIVIDCGPLTDPPNGQVNTPSGTSVGRRATYTCNTGYTLSSSQPLTCEADGNWTFLEVSCKGD